MTHIFHTSYDTVDTELPALLRRYRPDALLMFGLAAETPHLRIETWARNAMASAADAAGAVPPRNAIAPGGQSGLALPTPARDLRRAARRAGILAAVSEDAGDYLCNYLCWRAALAARKAGGPRFAAFIHVPNDIRPPDLARAGRAFLAVIAKSR